MSIPLWCGEGLPYGDRILDVVSESTELVHEVWFGSFDKGQPSVCVRPKHPQLTGHPEGQLVVEATANDGSPARRAEPISRVLLSFPNLHNPPLDSEHAAYLNALRITGELAVMGMERALELSVLPNTSSQ
jgi:hypothetical protein